VNIPILAHFAAASHILPAYGGLSRWKKINTPMKVFTVFWCVAVVLEIVEFVLGRLGIHNQFVINIFFLIQCECFLYLYYHWTILEPAKNIIKFAQMVFFIAWMIDVSFTPFPDEFRETILTAGNVILIFSSIFILQTLLKLSTISLLHNSIFWIGCGTIVYSTGTLIVWAMSNTMMKMGVEYFAILWHINWGFAIIANVLYARSFWCKEF